MIVNINVVILIGHAQWVVAGMMIFQFFVLFPKKNGTVLGNQKY